MSSANTDWRALGDELARWHDAGLAASFWWRDDDATRVVPAYERMVRLAEDAAVPLALAVVPNGAQADVVAPHSPWLTVLQHGVAHVNLAASGDKKTEFPAHEPVADALARLRGGRVALGGAALPVLVPPWNRIGSPELVGRLAGAGYCGISRFGPRKAVEAAPGLVQVNTHVDIIDWRGSRGFAGEQAVLSAACRHLRACREGTADAGEAIGWLSHHLVHDDACWDFLARLFDFTRRCEGVAWCGARSLFAPPRE